MYVLLICMYVNTAVNLSYCFSMAVLRCMSHDLGGVLVWCFHGAVVHIMVSLLRHMCLIDILIEFVTCAFNFQWIKWGQRVHCTLPKLGTGQLK